MAADPMELKFARRRLARIRCIQDCIQCFRCNKPMPKAICYIPARIEYKVTKNSKAILYEEPTKKSSTAVHQTCASDGRMVASAEELCNSEGQWVKVTSYSDAKSEVEYPSEVWLLLYSAQSLAEESATFVPVSTPTSESKEESASKDGKIRTWEEVTEHEYSLHLDQDNYQIAAADEAAADRMSHPPPNWSLEHDEDLALFLGAHVETEAENLGCIKNYVESIDVSSYCEDDASDNLTDGDTDTYWESDGSQGQHWIRLRMKKGTIIKRLFVTVDSNDDNYMPYRIVVMGGELDSLKKVNEVTVDQSLYGTFDVSILEDQREHHPIIEIRIKECKDDGIDTRIRGIKIKSIKERDLGLSRDNFSPENLVRFPKLECFSPDILYRRALLLQRFIKLLDSVLPYIVPAWEYSVGSYSSLEVVRQFLPLSKKRITLTEILLRESETCRPSRMPKLYINRRAAAEHKSDPTKDRDCKNTVFNQIYEGLKPRDRSEKPLDYRWPARHDQWWECKFLAEGIIDQGGGFRDSLSDLADEICPSAPDVPVPLPFFIRSPNQNQMDSNVNRDVYIPSPANRELHKYEWIGKVMGACLRGKESLVLSLPSFIWKKMAGERVTWSRDYITIDEAEVKLIENLDGMDEVDFDAYFGSGGRTWSCTQSDGTMVPLRPDGENIPVAYEDRHEYGQAVIDTRMKESNDQTEALRQGLLQVVPQAVLDLLTWQELERRICGDPEVSVDALKRATHYDDVEEADQRVKTLWEALSRFSNEDRSRFLRFVTGRRRLPAAIFICCEKGEAVDALPESSTCSNTLYLPRYSSVKKAEDKLRYAAYNCIAIDTDMNPWGE